MNLIQFLVYVLLVVAHFYILWNTHKNWWNKNITVLSWITESDSVLNACMLFFISLIPPCAWVLMIIQREYLTIKYIKIKNPHGRFNE